MTLHNLGIILSPLKILPTVGGDVMHALKSSESCFTSFGEAYFSLVTPNAVKAWKRHNSMTMNLVVPFGHVRFVFTKDNSNFIVQELGPSSYSRLTVPPGVWFGFKGIASQQSIILNVASVEHDPMESDRCDVSSFKYNWG